MSQPPKANDSPELLKEYQANQEFLDLLGESHALKAQAFQEKWGDPEDMGAPWNPSLNLNDAARIIENSAKDLKNGTTK